jgi:hypothetical protein
LSAAEAEKDRANEEKISALLENEQLKEELVRKNEEKDELEDKVRDMREMADEIKKVVQQVYLILLICMILESKPPIQLTLHTATRATFSETKISMNFDDTSQGLLLKGEDTEAL